MHEGCRGAWTSMNNLWGAKSRRGQKRVMFIFYFPGSNLLFMTDKNDKTMAVAQVSHAYLNRASRRGKEF